MSIDVEKTGNLLYQISQADAYRLDDANKLSVLDYVNLDISEEMLEEGQVDEDDVALSILSIIDGEVVNTEFTFSEISQAFFASPSDKGITIPFGSSFMTLSLYAVNQVEIKLMD